MKLSGEAAVDKITLDGVRGLRVTLSATVHDVLYYMSPIYCQDIIDSVSVPLFFSYKVYRVQLFIAVSSLSHCCKSNFVNLLCRQTLTLLI